MCVQVTSGYRQAEPPFLITLSFLHKCILSCLQNPRSLQTGQFDVFEAACHCKKGKANINKQIQHNMYKHATQSGMTNHCYAGPFKITGQVPAERLPLHKHKKNGKE